MQLAKVKGTITSTVKHAIYDSEKLLLIQPVAPNGKAIGSELVALDRAQAGVGDVVLYIDEGNSTRMILENSEAPVRTIIVGYVDEINIEGNSELVK